MKVRADHSIPVPDRANLAPLAVDGGRFTTHPVFLALMDIAVTLFGHGFGIAQYGGLSPDHERVPTGNYYIPGLAPNDAFCMAIAKHAPASFEHCQREFKRESDEAASGASCQRVCRFGHLRCAVLAPIRLNGVQFAHLIGHGFRRRDDPAVAFEEIRATILQQNPGANMEAIAERFEALREVESAEMDAFLALTERMLARLAREEWEKQRIEQHAATQPQAGFLFLAETPRQQIVYSVHKFRTSDLPIVIEGESGTGKELLAREIHAGSLRRRKPLVVIPCGQLASSLIEAELFGYVRGAFTGATRDFAGYFERADGGTVLLDEPCELPRETQTKLLRVLETGRLRPVGGTREIHVSVRILVSTTHNLPAEAAAGRLMQALLYRIHGISLVLPPLRGNSKEIEFYALEFLAQYNAAHRTHKSFTQDAMRRLQEYPWPGNLRELKNAVLQAATVASKKINVHSLPPDLRSYDKAAADRQRVAGFPLASLQPQLDALERAHIARVLTHCEGNIQQTARLLGIPRRTLYRKMKLLGLQSGRESSEPQV